MDESVHKLNFLKRLIIFPIYIILVLWHLSLRIKISKQAKEAITQNKASCAILFWHNQLFIAPKLRNMFRRNRIMYGLVSPSKDGAWLVELLKKFNVFCIRGSSSRRGKEAIKEIKAIKNSANCDIVITPDGPRGPKYKCKKGSIKFIAEENLPVILISIKNLNAWSLNTWDLFAIPKPFSTIVVAAKYFTSLPSLPEDELLNFVEENLTF